MSTYTFTAHLGISPTEALGPSSNSRGAARPGFTADSNAAMQINTAVAPLVTVLNPDQYQENAVLGRSQTSQRETLQTKVTWLSGYKGANNRELRDGDTFTVTDSYEANYLINMYGINNGTTNVPNATVPVDRQILSWTVS